MYKASIKEDVLMLIFLLSDPYLLLNTHAEPHFFAQQKVVTPWNLFRIDFAKNLTKRQKDASILKQIGDLWSCCLAPVVGVFCNSVWVSSSSLLCGFPAQQCFISVFFFINSPGLWVFHFLFYFYTLLASSGCDFDDICGSIKFLHISQNTLSSTCLCW